MNRQPADSGINITDPRISAAYVRARECFDRGDYPAAEQLCRQHLARFPSDWAALLLMSRVAAKADAWSEAEYYARLAVAAAPDEPNCHFQRASALRNLGREEECVACYRQGLAIAPEDVTALARLGYVHTVLGQFDEARRLYRKALELDPDYGAAYHGLALLHDFQLNDPLLEEMEAASRRIPDSDQGLAAVNFALGRAWHQLGDYDKAFERYRTANRIRQREAPFSQAEERANTRALIEAHDERFFQRHTGHGSDSEQPVFIVGMPRSGSTLVEQILDSHPAIAGVGEVMTFPRVFSSRIGSFLPTGAAVPADLRDAHPAVWSDIATAYLQEVRSLAPDAERIVDKQLFNYTMVGLLHMAFPKARIVHCTRDPLDTCLSCYFANFAANRGFAWDLENLGVAYREYQRLMAHWQRMLPGVMVEVAYEDTITDVEGTARRLIDELGLEWSDACLDFHRNDRPVRTFSNTQVRKPVYKGARGRWRLYEKHLEPLRRALAAD